MRSFSLESILPQGALFEPLAEAVAFLKANGTFTTEAIEDSNIIDLIKKHTGLKIDLSISKEISYNAYVILPSMDKNHPFIKEFYRNWNFNDASRILLDVSATKPKGTVDTKTGRVSGVFAEISHDLHLAYDLIQGGKFTAKEIAAILLHEIGHLFTYYLHLGTTVQTGLHASVIAKCVVDAHDYEAKTKVLVAAERTLGIEFPNREALARLESNKANNAIQAVVLTQVAEKQKSESGTSLYEVRACEQIADHFAIQHGAAKDLVTALDKLGKHAGDDSHKSHAWFVIVQVIKFLLFATGLIFGGIFLKWSLLVYILATNPWVSSYDKPEQRIELIRQRLTHRLRDRKLSKEEIKDLKEDIDAIEDIKKHVKDKETLLELFWETFMSKGRRAKKELDFAKQVEAMVFNDTFKEAASFAILH